MWLHFWLSLDFAPITSSSTRVTYFARVEWRSRVFQVLLETFDFSSVLKVQNQVCERLEKLIFGQLHSVVDLPKVDELPKKTSPHALKIPNKRLSFQNCVKWRNQARLITNHWSQLQTHIWLKRQLQSERAVRIRDASYRYISGNFYFSGNSLFFGKSNLSIFWACSITFLAGLYD